MKGDIENGDGLHEADLPINELPENLPNRRRTFSWKLMLLRE